MFMPSGSTLMAITSAPASSRARGLVRKAAPCAQSITTFIPSRRRPSSERSACATYRSSACGSNETIPTSAPMAVAPRTSRRDSMPCSSASLSLNPSRPKNLIPLWLAGLCEAETTAPASAPASGVRKAAAGVGSTPHKRTSAPAESSPADSAASSRSPERRVSRTMSTAGRACRDRKAVAAARPSRSAISGVSSRLAIPRTPSVPNRRGTTATGCPRGSPGSLRAGADPVEQKTALPLRVLRSLAGLLEAVLAPLLRPGVPGEHAGPLEGDAELGVELHEGPGDPVADGARLARVAAALEQGVDVVGLLPAHEPERLQDGHPYRQVGKVFLEAAAPVDDELALAGHDPHPGDGLLASPGAPGQLCDRHRFLLPLPEGLDRHGPGLLRRMGVVRAPVHLELAGHRPAEAVVRKHAPDGLLDGDVGALRDQAVVADGLQPSGVPGVPLPDLGV